MCASWLPMTRPAGCRRGCIVVPGPRRARPPTGWCRSGAPVWGAALAGSAACGVAGALFNDSGPQLLVFATVLAAWVLVYLRAGLGGISLRGGDH